MLDDIYRGQSDGEIDLAYLEGQTLVRFIDKVWGRDAVRAYGRALASDEPITVSDVIRATEEVFGEPWTQFFAEWSRFVRSMP